MLAFGVAAKHGRQRTDATRPERGHAGVRMRPARIEQKPVEPILIQPRGRRREVDDAERLCRLAIEAMAPNARESVRAGDRPAGFDLDGASVGRGPNRLGAAVERDEQVREMPDVRGAELWHPRVEIRPHAGARGQHTVEPRGTQPVAHAIEPRRQAALIAKILAVRGEERISRRRDAAGAITHVTDAAPERRHGVRHALLRSGRGEIGAIERRQRLLERGALRSVEVILRRLPCGLLREAAAREAQGGERKLHARRCRRVVTGRASECCVQFAPVGRPGRVDDKRGRFFHLRRPAPQPRRRNHLSCDPGTFPFHRERRLLWPSLHVVHD